MKILQAVTSGPRRKKILLWAIAAFVLFTVTGFFIVPPVLKSILIKKLSENLHREVSIGKIQFNPYVLSLKITGFAVKERGSTDTFLSFDELYVNIQSISIFKRGLVVKETRLQSPYINIKFNEDRSYNFSDLIVKGKPEEKKEPFRFSLNNISIANGNIDFIDNPKHTHHKIKDINFNIPFVSNLPYYTETRIRPAFEAKVNDTPVSFTGSTKPFADSFETQFNVKINDFDIPFYFVYIPFQPDFNVPSGKMDAALNIAFINYKDRQPAIAVSGSVIFREIKTTGKDGSPLVSLPLLDINILSSDLMAKRARLSRVFFQSPGINAVRSKKGTLNLLSFIPASEQNKPEEKNADKGTPLLLNIDEILVKEGKVSFEDLLPDSKFSTQLDQIDIKVSGFSNAKEQKTSVEASMQSEAKESFKLAAGLTVDPLSSEGMVEFGNLILNKYHTYYSDKILFDVRDGSVDLSTGYSFSKSSNGPNVVLSDLAVKINSLKLKKRDEKNDFLDIPSLLIKGTNIDLPQKKIVIGDFSTQKGMIDVKRFQDGSLNLSGLVASTPDATQKPAINTPSGPEDTWSVTVANMLAEQYILKFEDTSPADAVAVTVDKIRLKGSNISTEKKAAGRIALSLNQGKGSISAGGRIIINPLSAQLKLKVNNLEVYPLQPYFTDKVKILVAGGNISADGNLVFSQLKNRDINLEYKGTASLTNLATVDKANADDFLKWDSLYLSGIDIGYNPTYVNIEEIALSDFYSRLIIYQDGSLNVQGIVTSEKKTETMPKEGQTAGQAAVGQSGNAGRMVKIGKVTLHGGTINFTDQHITPNYSANFLEIGGRVSGLSSEEDKFADVDLRGTLDNYAPIEITGRINPLREDLFVDLNADFRDIDLSPVTPYSGRYVGYTIEKGKLTLNLRYLIVNKKLDAGNKIFLDQFTFGDRVESPDATKLPVKLAIALLKNRKGEINLDLPVTGNIDDPEFHIGRIIIKILLNLLAKAATAPFALLGAIFGGGEELSFLEFDYGLPAINEEGSKKLDTLIKALFDRPSLKLEIAGYVDIERDREGLRQYFFDRKIKAQKLKEIIKKGEQAVPVDEIKIDKDEYLKYLKMAYKEEKFPKPRNIIGMAKDLPVPEMEKLMFTHLAIKDDDLRALAAQRAMKVKDYILKSEQVEPQRIFLIEPKTLQPEKKEKLKDSRTEFTLK